MSLLDRVTIAPLAAGSLRSWAGSGRSAAPSPTGGDPAAFLARMAEEAGPVFTLNMAGTRMTVVTDPELLRGFHQAPKTC